MSEDRLFEPVPMKSPLEAAVAQAEADCEAAFARLQLRGMDVTPTFHIDAAIRTLLQLLFTTPEQKLAWDLANKQTMAEMLNVIVEQAPSKLELP